MKKIILVLLFLAISLNAKIIFALISVEDKEIMINKFSPLANYLSQELKEKVEFKVKSYKEIEKGLLDGKCSMAYLSPPGAINLIMQNRAVLPIVKVKRKGKSSYRAVIVAKKGGDVKKIKGLTGKIFAFGDKFSTSKKNPIPIATLAKSGLSMESFKKVIHTGSQSNVVRAVISGKADGGFIREELYQRNQEELIALQYSDKIPEFVIIANLKKISREKSMKIKKILLKLKDKKILTPIKATNFVRAFKSEYQKFAYQK